MSCEMVKLKNTDGTVLNQWAYLNVRLVVLSANEVFERSDGVLEAGHQLFVQQGIGIRPETPTSDEIHDTTEHLVREAAELHRCTGAPSAWRLRRGRAASRQRRSAT